MEKLVSNFPGVLHGPLYYHNLEKDKSTALANKKENFDAHMKLSTQAIAELTWWSLNILDVYKPIFHREVSMVLTTEASKKGSGAECVGVSTGGLWSNLEANEHINYLELLATFLGLKTFAQAKCDIHIRLMIDNTSAVSFINNIGTSHSDKCNVLVKQLWE